MCHVWPCASADLSWFGFSLQIARVARAVRDESATDLNHGGPLFDYCYVGRGCYFVPCEVFACRKICICVCVSDACLRAALLHRYWIGFVQQIVSAAALATAARAEGRPMLSYRPHREVTCKSKSENFGYGSQSRSLSNYREYYAKTELQTSMSNLRRTCGLLDVHQL